MSYGHYNFVGEFLAGVFPAMQLGQSGPAAKAQVHGVDLIDLTRRRDAKYARERDAQYARERNVKYARESDDVIDLSGGFGTLRRDERRIQRAK
jgi:predicted Rossmann-fold nucleotide-binding protein